MRRLQQELDKERNKKEDQSINKPSLTNKLSLREIQSIPPQSNEDAREARIYNLRMKISQIKRDISSQHSKYALPESFKEENIPQILASFQDYKESAESVIASLNDLNMANNHLAATLQHIEARQRELDEMRQNIDLAVKEREKENSDYQSFLDANHDTIKNGRRAAGFSHGKYCREN